MKKYDNLYLSKKQWDKLRNSVTEKIIIPLTRKQFSVNRIKKSLRAIKLSQQRLVELDSFNALFKKHNLKQESYSRETIAKLLNKPEIICDREFIEWIKIFMSFFYTDLCLFISPEEHPDEDPEEFNVWLQNYWRRWEDRKDEQKYVALQMKAFEDLNCIVSRKKAIVGRWEGKAVQVLKDGTRIPEKVEGELKMLQDDMIRGELHFSFKFQEEKITSAIKLYGRFLYASFLRFNYENCDDFVKQFGAAILELDTTGLYLDGNYIGYGFRTKELFKADIHLKKVVDG